MVYSSRIDELIKPVFDAYTKKTGVAIKFITDKEAPLMARIKAEGANTPADLLLTVDGGNLWQAEEMGILQPLNSQVVKDNIPAQYRSSSDAWTGLSLRARTIVYSPERVKDGELTTYEALADKNWEGRLCLRTSKKVYNQSLTATMIETHGAEKTEQILKGWVNNLATDVFADDNAVVMAVDAGQCDVGIVNTYYFGRLHAQNPQLSQAVLAEPAGPWRARQPVGHRSDQARAESGCCAQAGGVDDQRRGSEHFRGHQYGIPGQPGRETVRRSCGMGRVQGRHHSG